MAQEIFKKEWDKNSQESNLCYGNNFFDSPSDYNNSFSHYSDLERPLTGSQEAYVFGELSEQNYDLLLDSNIMNEENAVVEFVPQEELINNFNSVPCLDNWKGNYNFHLNFGIQKKVGAVTKSASWTYSEVLDKLFVSVYKECPIGIVLDSEVPENCYIRILPVFSKSEHITEIVKRCPNHSSPSDEHNQDPKHHPDHLVRCASGNCIYEEDKAGRLSIRMNYFRPEAGAESTNYLLKFMCYGSCVGGLNRKPLKLIFTLEKDFVVLGRQTLDVKICACPGRDRRAEEKNSKKNSGQNNEENQEQSFKRKREDDESYFIIKVKKQEHFDYLIKMKQSLELAELVPKEQRIAYLNKDGVSNSMASNSKIPRKPKFKREDSQKSSTTCHKTSATVKTEFNE